MKHFNLVLMFVLCANLCSACLGSKNGNSSDSDTSESIDRQSIENQVVENSGVDQEYLKQRIKTIWFELPPALDIHSPNFEQRVLAVMSKSFGKTFKEGVELYREVDRQFETDPDMDPDMIIGLAETVFGFWGGQDPDPNGRFESIEFIELSDNRAVANVVFMNYSSTWEHKLVLVNENGEWVIDNIDDTKELIHSWIQEEIDE